DELLTRLQPVEKLAGAPPWTYTYDGFGNRVSQTDPNGSVTAWQYDSANRQVLTEWTRGPSGSTAMPAATCRASVTGDAPIPSGRVLCFGTQSYDGVDNLTATQDGNGATSTFFYDGIHRRTSQQVPRSASPVLKERTDTAYDPDGHATDLCPPREFDASEPNSAAATAGVNATCSSTGYYSTHRSYDFAGKLLTDKTYEEHAGSASTYDAHTTTYAYDADGNPRGVTDAANATTTATFDLLDRRLSQTQPRDGNRSFTTTWAYDPAG